MNDFIPTYNTAPLAGANITEKLIIAALAGYRMVEVSYEDIRHDAAMAARSLQDLKMDTAAVTYLQGWYETDGGLMGVPDNHDKILDECKRRVERAAEIGATCVIATTAYDHRGYFAEVSKGSDNFYDLYQIGKEFGVDIALAFLGESPDVNTIPKALDFLNAIGDPNAKMVLDSFQIWRGGGDIDDLRMVSPWRIAHLRVSDGTAGIKRIKHRDRDRTIPGTGVIDNKTFLEIASEIGYEGPVTVDIRRYATSIQEGAEFAAQALTALKGVMYS